MKLKSIRVTGLLAAKTVAISSVSPVHLIAAASCESGKTTVARDALSLLLGRIPRALKKGDSGSLVSLGHDKASVEIHAVDAIGKAAINKSNQVKVQQLGDWGQNALADFLLDPAIIADRRITKADALKSALFAALGLSAEKDAIRAELLRRGRDAEQIGTLLPLLRGESGMAAAAEHAEKKATEAKGEWKAITGEQWGSVKAESWVAAAVEAPSEAAINGMHEQLARCQKISMDAGAAVITLRERLRAKGERAQAIERHEAAAANRQRAERKLETDRTNQAEQQRIVDELAAKAGDAPREGLVHDLAAALAWYVPSYGPEPRDIEARSYLEAYRTQYGEPGRDAMSDPEASAALPAARQSLELMQRAAANSERDLRAVCDAEAALKALRATEADTVSASALTAAEDDEKLAKQAVQAAQAELDKARAQVDQAVNAGTNTSKAASVHTRITSWLALAGDLGPDGIPGEMLARAIGPINKHMLASCADLEIEPVQLHPDMSVTKGAHQYALLSPGGRWITNAVLGAALAAVSGQAWICLDGMDVLPPSQRVGVLWWLSRLAEAGELGTALVTATLGSKPTNLSELPLVGLTWIKDGVSEEVDAEFTQTAP